jgi:hypothetical protein
LYVVYLISHLVIAIQAVGSSNLTLHPCCVVAFRPNMTLLLLLSSSSLALIFCRNAEGQDIN